MSRLQLCPSPSNTRILFSLELIQGDGDLAISWRIGEGSLKLTDMEHVPSLQNLFATVRMFIPAMGARGGITMHQAGVLAKGISIIYLGQIGGLTDEMRIAKRLEKGTEQDIGFDLDEVGLIEEIELVWPTVRNNDVSLPEEENQMQYESSTVNRAFAQPWELEDSFSLCPIDFTLIEKTKRKRVVRDEVKMIGKEDMISRIGVTGLDHGELTDRHREQLAASVTKRRAKEQVMKMISGSNWRQNTGIYMTEFLVQQQRLGIRAGIGAGIGAGIVAEVGAEIVRGYEAVYEPGTTDEGEIGPPFAPMTDSPPAPVSDPVTRLPSSTILSEIFPSGKVSKKSVASAFFKLLGRQGQKQLVLEQEHPYGEIIIKKL